MYDVTQTSEENRLLDWIKDVKYNCGPSVNIILAGNKIDSKDRFGGPISDDLLDCLKDHQVSLVEISCKTMEGLDQLNKALNLAFYNSVHLNRKMKSRIDHFNPKEVKIIGQEKL